MSNWHYGMVFKFTVVFFRYLLAWLLFDWVLIWICVILHLVSQIFKFSVIKLLSYYWVTISVDVTSFSTIVWPPPWLNVTLVYSGYKFHCSFLDNHSLWKSITMYMYNVHAYMDLNIQEMPQIEIHVNLSMTLVLKIELYR